MNTIFKGQPVHYSIHGDGFPLVLLHGFNENSDIWKLIEPEISRFYKIICIDLPGFGKSGLPGNLSISNMADAVFRVIEETGLQKPVVIGHSMGGYVTLELLHKHPNYFSGAGLFHSTAFADSDDKKANRAKTIQFLEKNPLKDFLKVFIQGLFAPFNLKNIHLSFVEDIVYSNHTMTVSAATKAMMEREDRTSALKTNPLPWLFIAGKHDQLIPIENISLQSSFCKRSMFHVLQQTGHLGMIEEPAKTCKIILEFMEWVKQIELQENKQKIQSN